MAHNINYNEQTEKHSFFSVKEKAWHNLGQIIQDYPTSAEAIKHSGLDYEVEKRKLFTLAYRKSVWTAKPSTIKLKCPITLVPYAQITIRYWVWWVKTIKLYKTGIPFLFLTAL